MDGNREFEKLSPPQRSGFKAGCIKSAAKSPRRQIVSKERCPMPLQEIVCLQNARNQAYRADINHIARYGDGSLPADTRIVILHQKFAGGK